MVQGFLNGSSKLPDYATDVSSLDTRSVAAIALQAASMVAIIIIALGGNTLILLAIYIDKTLQTITNVFIVNLACADLLLTIIGMPFTLVSSITYRWIFSDTWCKVNGMANSLFCVASILTLAAVSIDRYLAILYPFKYATWMTNKVAACMIVYIWCHALLIACLPLTSWSRYTFISSESICTVQWDYSIAYTLFLFSVCFFLPLGAMVFTYLRIFHTAKKQSRKVVPVTGTIEGKDEPSFSGIKSNYDSQANLTGTAFPLALPTDKLKTKSAASVSRDIYDDERVLNSKITSPTAHLYERQEIAGQQAENLNRGFCAEPSTDSGCEGPITRESTFSRIHEQSASDKRLISSANGCSGDTMRALNRSCGSLQDSAVIAYSLSELANTKYYEATQNDSTSPITNVIKGSWKNGEVNISPPLQNSGRKKETDKTLTKVEVDEPPAAEKTLYNNFAAKENIRQQSDVKYTGEEPVANRCFKAESKDRFNQSNNLSASSSSIQTKYGEKGLFNISMNGPECSSTPSFAHTNNGVQSNNFESQREKAMTPTRTRKKRFSTASIVKFSKPNSFRVFSKSSLAILKLRKRKDVQARVTMRRETKAAKTLLIVVGTFVLCWTPHFVGIFCLLSEQCSWPDVFFAITTWLAMLNSACNPVIYGVMSRQFRKRFKQILQCKKSFF